MKRICQIVLYVIIALWVISLCACGKTQPVSETIADNAVNATTALEQQLPKECKTAAITTQFDVVRTEIKSVKTACQTEKDIITKEKLQWKVSFWALIGVIIAYILRKVTK